MKLERMEYGRVGKGKNESFQEKAADFPGNWTTMPTTERKRIRNSHEHQENCELNCNNLDPICQLQSVESSFGGVTKKVEQVHFGSGFL